MQGLIRKVIPTDIPNLKKVVDDTELFPSEMLNGMIEDFLYNPASTDLWFTYLKEGNPIAIGYCAPERMTDGTYNLYAIGVLKGYQGKSIGRQMMDYLENLLVQKGARILLVETSGKPQFALTREFYHKCHYIQQAVIPEFYEKGDDKVVFWKRLVE